MQLTILRPKIQLLLKIYQQLFNNTQTWLIDQINLSCSVQNNPYSLQHKYAIVLSILENRSTNFLLHHLLNHRTHSCKTLTTDSIYMPAASANLRTFTFGSSYKMSWIF